MSIKNRVCKIEQQINGNKRLSFVAVMDGETNEQAYKRCFADGSAKPKHVIYASALDLGL